MDKKSFPLKTQSYIANAIYIAVAFIINANNNSNFVLFLSITFYPITFYPITFYPITIQTLTIMIIVHIVKSEGEGALTPYKGSAWKTDFPTSRELS
ncbi:hypothetical protein ELD98_26470 [Escherichia coli]|uniref:Uncharacterized protein n=1 Tax=Escherichia coli TaxID=562 RepID=A0A890DHJ7_ECOLX|nr:hypothetical protein [Escherichia coli]QRG43893.1 hypothetical protein [Escherichia coli]RJT77853.1 hypothetical protein D6D46_18780 [Escherichia coli]